MEKWALGTVSAAVEHTGRTDGLPAEVCMALVDPVGRVLVSRKHSYPEEAWRLPSGGVMDGESPRDAFFREAFEEVGLIADDVADLHPVARVLYAHTDFTSYLYVGELQGTGPATPSSDELTHVRWVDLGELSSISATLEQLAETNTNILGESRGRDWRAWGLQRAVVHDVLEDFLVERFPPVEELELRLLGGVRLVRGNMVTQQSGKSALLLALLGLAAPQSVSALDLYKAAWGVPDPEDERKARTAAEKELSRLRTSLGLSEEQLRTYLTQRDVPPRYELQVTTDVAQFRHLSRVANQLASNGSNADAIGALGEAIALWQGPVAGGALAGVSESNFFAGQVEALEAEFLAARIKLLELQLEEGNDLAVSMHGALLLGEEPFNEQVVELVMLALYRSGQYVPAAQKFREYRGRLRRDYGTEPGAALVELNQRVLSRDPSLELLRKKAFTGGDGQELQMYWGYRPAAHNDIRQSLLGCREQLVVAGQGVSTLSDILNDPNILRSLVSARRENPNLKITIVMATAEIPHRGSEAGGQRLANKTEAGRAALTRFQRNFNKRSGSDDSVDLRTYTVGFLVRHFFLRCDEAMYVGSYLSHEEGSHSYLMKLKNFEDGLFDLFDAELAHVLANTTALKP
ncbi:BTAD domain-containing putative transcriptional regulator [Nocardioides marmoraquaticus]